MCHDNMIMVFGLSLFSDVPLPCECQAVIIQYQNRRRIIFLFVTYTIIQSITSSEMCSLHLTHPSAHTWSSGQPTLQRPGSSWGFGALVKGLTSVIDKYYLMPSQQHGKLLGGVS